MCMLQADLYQGVSSLFAADCETHSSLLEHSGKMQVLASLLSTVHAAQRCEKVVIVSSYTSVCCVQITWLLFTLAVSTVVLQCFDTVGWV